MTGIERYNLGNGKQVEEANQAQETLPHHRTAPSLSLNDAAAFAWLRQNLSDGRLKA